MTTNLPARAYQLTQNPNVSAATCLSTQTLAAQPWRIIFYIGILETVMSMGLEVSTPLTIGRADLVEQYIPGVDRGLLARRMQVSPDAMP